MPRFVLLEHTGAPDDPAGRHFDLLLELAGGCRTWRLAEPPRPGGPPVAADEIAPHALAWLERTDADVSGGRGRARRVAAGRYDVVADGIDPASAEPLELRVVGDMLAGLLRLWRRDGAWFAALAADTA